MPVCLAVPPVLMALTLFLFQVSHLDVERSSVGSSDEQPTLLSAKVIFRGTRRAFPELLRPSSSLGINLWSNNVPLHEGTSSFVARGERPKKFTFHLATMLKGDELVRLEFYVISRKKKRKKLVGSFELLLEALIGAKHLDLAEENLSDLNNSLLAATVQLKLFYRPPNLGTDDDDDEDDGRHGGHRRRYIHCRDQRGL